MVACRDVPEISRRTRTAPLIYTGSVGGCFSLPQTPAHPQPRQELMARWLFKEEPEHYSYSDLERERTTRWDGVTNNLARLHLRQVRRGDRILYYHTGKEKAVVGEMRADSDAGPDSNSGDPKAVVVEVRAVR